VVHRYHCWMTFVGLFCTLGVLIVHDGVAFVWNAFWNFAALTNSILVLNPFSIFDVFVHNFDVIFSILAFLCVHYTKDMEHLVECNPFPSFTAWASFHCECQMFFVVMWPPHTPTRRFQAAEASLFDFQAGMITIQIRTLPIKSNPTRGTESFLYCFEDLFHYTLRCSGSSSDEGVRYYRCTPSFFKLWPVFFYSISAS